MSLWFVSAAILPEIVAEGGLGPGRAAALSSAVQIGFVLGALGARGPRDRRPLRPARGHRRRRRWSPPAANLALLVTPVGGSAQVRCGR